MDTGTIITLIVLAFGAGACFARIEFRLNKLDRNIIPLVLIHKDELIKYYIAKGILPNPSMTPRKQYLLDRLRDNTISRNEYTELSTILERERREAERTNNTEALVAILGLIALVAILISLVKK